jgi:hypothetical protein
MNNILLPRSLFVHSPLGQVLLLNATNASIAATSFNSLLRAAWDPATWQARVLGYSNWNGSSYSPGTQKYIKVYSNTNQNCSNGPQCGVVPSDLAASSQVPSYAVESIFALNLTGTAGLKGFLAGLLLNSSGNYSNWGFAATPFLPSLGLSSEVLTAIANPVEFNGGGFVAPVYQHPSQPQTWWQAAGSAVWNAVSGTVGAVLSVAWSWVQAAGAYVAYLASEVANWGLQAIQQTVSVLKQVAGAIVWAIDQLASIVVGIVQGILNAILQPAEAGLTSYVSALNHDFSTAWSTVNSTGAVNLSEANAVGTDFGGAPFDIAIGIGIAVTVALTLLTPLDFGPSFLIGIVIGLIAGAILSLGVVAHAAGSLTAAAVFSLEKLVNSSLVLPVSEWATIAGIVGLVAAGSDIPFSWYVLAQAFKLSGGVQLAGDAAAVMATSMIAVFFGAIAVATENGILLLFAFALSALALTAVATHFFGSIMDDFPSIKNLGLIDLGLAGSALVGSAIDLGINWHKV